MAFTSWTNHENIWSLSVQLCTQHITRPFSQQMYDPQSMDNWCFLLLYRHISMTLPASFRGKNTTRPDYEHQNSNLYAISGQSRSPWKPLTRAFADRWSFTKVAVPRPLPVFSAMDGVPFVISEKFACTSSDVRLFSCSRIIILILYCKVEKLRS